MIQQKHEQSTQSPEQIGYEKATAELEAFVENPALNEVLVGSGFDITQAETLERGEYLKNMRTFANEHWNFRKGRERTETTWDDKPTEQSVYYEQFVLLGMVESSGLSNGQYDFLLVLGGANRSPIQRLQYGLEQDADYKHIVMLGAGRPVSAAEQKKTADYAPGAKNEYDLMDGAARTLLGGTIVAEEMLPLQSTTPKALPEHWKTNYFETSDGRHVFSLHTDFELQDTSSAQNRAKTGDTYKFLRSLAGDMLNPDAKVALVTNALFTNAQRLDAIREITLQTGAEVEAVGFDAAYSGVERTEKQLFAELRAAIAAADRLQTALSEQK